MNFVGGADYAIKTNTIKSITVENCTVKNYGYGFLYANKSTTNVVVKNVTVDGGNYGFHWVYGSTATLENVKMTNVTNGLYIQNYASKTITIKDSTISSIAIWERSGYAGVQTFKFEGTNTVGTLSASQYAKYVLNATDAKLTAPAGATVTSGVDAYVVKYIDGAYQLVAAVAQVGNNYYATLQEAIEAADNNDIIVLIADIDIANAEIVKLDGKYNTYFKVAGKTITIDLNGKTISGDYAVTNVMLVGLFSTENGGHLTITGNGTVNVTASGDQVYSLIANYEPGCSITIENGTFTLDKAIDSLVYSGCGKDENEGIVINGGTFELGNVGTGANGKPWIFNVLGGNNGYVVVNGGTFNADINHQFWANEVFVPETKALKANGNNTWKVVDAVAYVKELATSTGGTVRNVGYATFAEAYAAAKNKGYTIVLLADGLNIGDINENVTILKGEHTVTVGTLTAGTYDWNVKDNCENGYCAKANNDGTWTVAELFKFYGSNLNMGNDLDLKFAFKAGNIADKTGYYVIINALGEDFKIESQSWVVDGNFYVVTFKGLAARQMTEMVSVTVYDANGQQISETYSDSIQAYAMRKFNNASGEHADKMRTLVVDLLNYGAAAQKYFANKHGYQVGTLANCDITPEQQEKYATKNADIDSKLNINLEQGDLWYGSNLTLDSQILFKVAFKKGTVDKTMKVYVDYTHHNGTTVSKEVVLVENNGYLMVVIDDLVIADATQILTITVKDADGNVVTTVQDSIEEYLARRVRDGKAEELEYAIMKFSNSAYNWLYRNDASTK